MDSCGDLDQIKNSTPNSFKSFCSEKENPKKVQFYLVIFFFHGFLVIVLDWLYSKHLSVPWTSLLFIMLHIKYPLWQMN